MKSGMTLSELVKETLETEDEETLIGKLVKRLQGSKQKRIIDALNSLKDLVETVALLRYLKEVAGRDSLITFLQLDTQLSYRLIGYVDTEEWKQGKRLGKWLVRKYGRRIYEGL